MQIYDYIKCRYFMLFFFLFLFDFQFFFLQFFVDLEIKIRGMQREINFLKDEIEDKDRLIERLEQENDKFNIEFDVFGFNRRERIYLIFVREVRSVVLSFIKSFSRGEQFRSRLLFSVRRVKDGFFFRQGDFRYRLLQIERKLDDIKNMFRFKVMVV